MDVNKFNFTFTHFDLRWPSSISPSISVTSVIDTSSPSLSPAMTMVVSSRCSQSVPQRVISLFFQCQFAVENDMGGGAVAAMIINLLCSRLMSRKVMRTNSWHDVWRVSMMFYIFRVTTSLFIIFAASNSSIFEGLNLMTLVRKNHLRTLALLLFS